MRTKRVLKKGVKYAICLLIELLIYILAIKYSVVISDNDMLGMIVWGYLLLNPILSFIAIYYKVDELR